MLPKHPLQDDPDSIVGRMSGPELPSEGDYLTTCPACKQAYDKRNLGEVLHHNRSRHLATQ